ncbi:MAG: AzlD domain-containing protein [Eubacteriales bacterium]|nr:AzlD domain-containing protein [Eubacteriales bacterium]
MTSNVYFSLLVMSATVYLIRMIPFVFLTKPITNRYARSFFFYVPYVTLAVMTFPAILTATDNFWSGLLALVVAGIVAWVNGDLFLVAISACVAVFLSGLVL